MKDVTMRETLEIISTAITENTTLTDALLFRGFSGKIIIDVEPNKFKIKDVKFEYTFKIKN